MKRILVMLVVGAVAFAVVACGSAGRRPSISRSGKSASASEVQSASKGLEDSEYDTDDHVVLNYASPASGTNERAVAALVKRYYRDAALGDGVGACSLTSPAVSHIVPLDYGQLMGSAIPLNAGAFLHGTKTCPAVLSLLFEHLHAKLAGAVQVTAVRLKDSYGFAIVGSTTLPASMIAVDREGARWRVDGLLGRPLP